MKKRDEVRIRMSTCNQKERALLVLQYRKLRNLVNSKVRQETIDFNTKRVEDAKNEAEMWNIVKEVSNPKSAAQWELKHLNIIVNAYDIFIV